jgi:hypothetical protein
MILKGSNSKNVAKTIIAGPNDEADQYLSAAFS